MLASGEKGLEISFVTWFSDPARLTTRHYTSYVNTLCADFFRFFAYWQIFSQS